MNKKCASPILLGGENRSGTTLLSVLLDSHNELVVGPEIDFLEPHDLGPHILEACALLLAQDRRVLGPGTDTEDPYWYDGAHFVKQCNRFGIEIEKLVAIVKSALDAKRSDLSSFEDRCFLLESIGEYRLAKAGVKQWGLKLQRKICEVDKYADFWPNARFVHIIRDGRDVAASHLCSVPWGYSTAREAAEGWMGVVARPRNVAPIDRYLEVRYEDLVGSPRKTLQQILGFLGLAWDEAVMRHHRLGHSLFDASWGHPAAEAAASPLYTDRIGRFKRDLDKQQILEFEQLAAQQLVYYGHELVSEVRRDYAD